MNYNNPIYLQVEQNSPGFSSSIEEMMLSISRFQNPADAPENFDSQEFCDLYVRKVINAFSLIDLVPDFPPNFMFFVFMNTLDLHGGPQPIALAPEVLSQHLLQAMEMMQSFIAHYSFTTNNQRASLAYKLCSISLRRMQFLKMLNETDVVFMLRTCAGFRASVESPDRHFALQPHGRLRSNSKNRPQSEWKPKFISKFPRIDPDWMPPTPVNDQHTEFIDLKQKPILFEDMMKDRSRGLKSELSDAYFDFEEKHFKTPSFNTPKGRKILKVLGPKPISPRDLLFPEHEPKKKTRRTFSYDNPSYDYSDPLNFNRPQSGWFKVDLGEDTRELVSGFNDSLLEMMDILKVVAESDTAAKVKDFIDDTITRRAEGETLGNIGIKIDTRFDPTSVVETMKRLVPTGAGLILAVSSGIHYYYTGNEKSLIISLLSGTFTAVYGGYFALLPALKKIYADNDRNRPQFDLGDIEGAVVALTTLLVGHKLSSSDSDKFVGNALKELGGFGRVKDSLASIATFCVNLCEKTVNLFRKHVLDQNGIRFMDTESSSVNLFLKLCDDISNEVDAKTFKLSVSNFQRVKILISTGEKLQREISAYPKSAGLMKIIDDQLRTYRTLKSKIVGANPEFEGVRPEPTGVLYLGGPGGGKSNSLEHTTYALVAQIIDSADKEAFLAKPAEKAHNRQAENIYWEGYHPDQLVCYFDDFGQARDAEGQPDNEFMNIIRAINGFPYNLHMAGMDKKGNNYFASRFVLATTNSMKLEPKSIISFDALKRRFHFAFLCAPKLEYCTEATRTKTLWDRKFDFNLLPKGSEGESKLHPDFLEYHTYNLFTNQPDGPVLSFAEHIELLMEHYGTQTRRYKQYMHDLHETYDKFEKNRPQVEYRFNAPVIEDGEIQVSYTDDEQVIQTIAEVDEIIGDVNHPEREAVATKLHSLNLLFKENGRFSTNWREHLVIMHTKLGDNFFYNFCVNDEVQFHEWLYRQHVVLNPLDQVSIHTNSSAKYVQRFRECLQGFKDAILVLYEQSGLNNFITYVQDLIENHVYVKSLIYLLGFITVPYALYKSVRSFLRYIAPHSKGFHAVYEDDAKLLIDSYKELNSHLAWDKFYCEPKVWKDGQLTDFGDSALNFWFNEFTGDFERVFGLATPQSIQASGRARSKNKPTRVVSRSSQQMREAATPQAGIKPDPNGQKIIDAIVNRNVWSVQAEQEPNDPNPMRLGHIILIKGRLALMPYHFIKFFDITSRDHPDVLDFKVFLTKGVSSRTYVVRDFILGHKSEFLDVNDACLVELPITFQPCRDITKNFATREEFGSMRVFPFSLVSKRPDREKDFGGIARAATQIVIDPATYESYTVCMGFEYLAVTKSGDCGAPFFVLDPTKTTSKLFGIHVSGRFHEGLGYSAFICREDLEACIELFQPQICDESLDVNLPQGVFTVHPDFQLVMNAPKKVSQGNKSKIIRSDLVVPWVPLKGPAILRPIYVNGERFDPLYRALEKYVQKKGLYIKPAFLNEVADCLFDDLNSQSSVPFESRVYTIHESVLGLVGEDGFNALPRSTSAGWPENTIPKGPGLGGKKFWLGTGIEYDLENSNFKQFEKDVYLYIEQLLARIRQLVVYTDCIKDELRKLSKLVFADSRAFSGAPWKYTVVFRMYFGSFFKFLYDNRIDNEIAVGVNPYSAEWDRMARKFKQFGVDIPNMKDGDYSGFDGSEIPPVHYWLLYVIGRFYNDGPENAIIREMLWLELVNSRHIVEDMIYEWEGSLPSGNPGTTYVNCLYNKFGFRFAWYDHHDYEASCLPMFKKKVCLQVVGDDNDYAVRGDARGFNGKAVAKGVAILGQKYTSANKEDEISDFVTLEETEFLKRRWRYDEYANRYVAPLHLDTIKEMVLWTKDKPDRDEIVFDNVANAIKEFSLHGREVFDEYVPTVAEALKKAYGKWPDTTSYLQNLRLILSETNAFL